MSPGVFNRDSQHYALELDEAVQSHLAWTRQVLRSAPDDDIAVTDAHLRSPVAFRTLRHRRRIVEGRTGDAGELDAFERTQAGVVAGLALPKSAHLARSSRLDAHTGLPLCHGLDEEFERSRAQARRHGERMVALTLDLDSFKEVNDAAGHATGDQAPQHVATLLRQQCRAGEPVFRFGGEEFLALLQAADRAAAERAADFLP